MMIFDGGHRLKLAIVTTTTTTTLLEMLLQ